MQRRPATLAARLLGGYLFFQRFAESVPPSLDIDPRNAKSLGILVHGLIRDRDARRERPLSTAPQLVTEEQQKRGLCKL
jgi:hypothetical protein